MRLSMWILADRLEKYNPKKMIQNGARILRNARLYVSEHKMAHSTVYIGHTGDFIDGTDKGVICANGHDMLLLDTDDINHVYNDIQDAFEYYNSWSDKLNLKIRDECSLQELLDESEEVFSSALALLDPSYYVYAHVGIEKWKGIDPEVDSILTEGTMRLNTLLAINQDKRIRVHNPHTYTMNLPFPGVFNAVRNIFFMSQHKGWLTSMSRDNPQTRGELDLQDELGDAVELWIGYNHTQKDLSERVSVFSRLLEGAEISDDEAFRRIESLNWKRSDWLQVYVFSHETQGLSLFSALDRKLEQLGNAYTVYHEDFLILILNRSMTDVPLFELELGSVLENIQHECGRSPVFADVMQLRSNYEVAKVANAFGSIGENRIKDIDDALLQYCLMLLKKNTSIGLRHPALKTLKEYDDDNGTRLFETLEVFLLCERNYAKAAAALFVHRNTLLYRMERIGEITKLNLDSPEVRLYLLMSFRFEQMK